MNNETRERLALFAENTQALKGFKWQGSLTKRLTAFQYAKENKRVDGDAVRRCHDLIKANTGKFSIFRGDMSLFMAALLSLSEEPEALLKNTLGVYDMLKGVKFRASDYLVVAAYQIAAGTDAASYSNAAERARAFYDRMKARNWFHTGQDDYIFAAMLGLSDLDAATGAERIDQIYNSLKKEFRDKNSVQALAQILVLCDPSDGAADRVLALRDELKAQKLRYDKSYTLSSLGVLALLSADTGAVIGDLIESRDFLRAQKGFSSWSVTTQELLLYAAGIVITEYAGSAADGVLAAALSTSINNIIIAQQTAMMIAVIASYSAAASSAASSS